MIVRSQNGWQAFHSPDEGNFVRFTVAGRGFWAATADVAVVAGEFLRRFDAEVERIILPGEVLNDWSFADRLIRGSTAAVSNHGSATAWDVNSDHHPLGAVGTFSDAQVTRIHSILRDITDDDGKPVLRWGGDYTGRKDEMHVEVNANAARIKQAANKIRAQHQEDDMPTVAEIVAGLRPTIRAEVRAQLIDVLQNEPLITNKATAAALADDPKAPSSKASVTWFLGNIEGDQDNDRDTDREARARLEAKVDQLLAKLGDATA